MSGGNGPLTSCFEGPLTTGADEMPRFCSYCRYNRPPARQWFGCFEAAFRLPQRRIAFLRRKGSITTGYQVNSFLAALASALGNAFGAGFCSESDSEIAWIVALSVSLRQQAEISLQSRVFRFFYFVCQVDYFDIVLKALGHGCLTLPP